jgi:hypothetical protein
MVSKGRLILILGGRFYCIEPSNFRVGTCWEQGSNPPSVPWRVLRRLKDSGHSKILNILWMEDILHHLGWLKPYNGINHLSTGAGFLTSTISKCLNVSKCTEWSPDMAVQPEFVLRETNADTDFSASKSASRAARPTRTQTVDRQIFHDWSARNRDRFPRNSCS